MSGLDEVDEITAWVGLEGIPSALVGARDAVDALLRDRGMRRTTPELTAESLLRGAAASALLEGGLGGSFDVAVEALRGGAAGPLATRAARLNAALLSLVPVVNRSPLQALARLHTLAAAGQTRDDGLGRPRPEPGVASRLQWLSRAILVATDVPAIAVAGIAHAEVATLAPFDGANGLVARAFER
nr:oxidoreductase [Propionibacteriales bacterium]